MIVIILVVLILMNGVGYFGAPQPGGYRYGYGGLGFLLLVLLVLQVLGFIHA